MKTKVFTSHAIQDLEAQINHFLHQNPEIVIQFVAQSESDASDHGWSATFTILYKSQA